MPGARATFALFALLFLGACTQAGSPAGSVCTTGSGCASGLCRGDPGAVHHCVAYCQSNADCTGAGELCGRVDLRFTDIDTGLPVDDDSEVVNLCRPRLNLACTSDAVCGTGGVCLGSAGVCTTTCGDNSMCPSLRCMLPPVCGLPGQCAPLCDDSSECPGGYFCTQVATGNTVHGYCLNVADAAVPATDCGPGPDASVPAEASTPMDATGLGDVSATQ